jgi:RNA polymerase sigma-70 factor (ECF subfamily)
MTAMPQVNPALPRNMSIASRPASLGDNSMTVSAEEKPQLPQYYLSLRRREGKAFEKLVELATPVLLAKAKQILRNEEDAADAVQDTFLVVYTSIESFRGESSIMTWMFRILCNNCLMKLRSSAGKTRLSIDAIESAARNKQGSNEFDTAAEAPACELETAEVKQRVHAYVGRLPSHYRLIIRLRDFQELDTEEVATILGIKPGAVKTRLHRARQALRALIEADSDEIDSLKPATRNLSKAIASNN